MQALWLVSYERRTLRHREQLLPMTPYLRTEDRLVRLTCSGFRRVHHDAYAIRSACTFRSQQSQRMAPYGSLCEHLLHTHDQS